MSVIIRRVTHARAVHLGPNYVRVPLTEDAVKENVTKFYSAFSVPQCLGAIDGTHIEIKEVN